MTAAPLQTPQLDLTGRVAIVVGAGQTAGPTIGNGRATALLLARAGATVIAADRDLASAEETAAMIIADGNTAEPLVADVTAEASLENAPGNPAVVGDIIHAEAGAADVGANVLPGLTASMPLNRASWVTWIRRSAFLDSLPATYMREVSPYQPSTTTVTSTFRISPSFSRLSPGMPWQTTWLTLMQLACW